MTILAVTALLAWQAATGAIIAVTRASNAGTALRFNATDPVALVATADQLIFNSKGLPDFKRVNRLARQALVSRALNGRALRILGQSVYARDEPTKAAKLIQMAVRSTRRETGAQLWLIEESVSRNDSRAALAHYDTALRTSKESRAVLFPVLDGALSDALLQAEFARFVKSPPIWFNTFLEYVIGGNGNFVGVSSAIIKGGGLPIGDRYRVLETALLGQLAANGKYAELRSFSGTMPGFKNNMLTSTIFDKANTDLRFTPITWQAFETPGIAVSFNPVGDGNVRSLYVEVASGERGVAVRKIAFFLPGTYTFNHVVKLGRFTNGAAAYWELNCLRDMEAVAIWRSNGDLASSPTNSSVNVSIPTDCTTQALQLIVAGGADQAGADLSIGQMSLTRKR